MFHKKLTAQIYIDNDPHKFKFLKFNRERKGYHIAKLAKVLKDQGYNFNKPIEVDRDFNIIDGQHRIEALKLLQQEGIYLAFSYILTNKGIENIPASQIGLKWTINDYVHYYARRGSEDYIYIEEIVNKYNTTVYCVCNALVNGSKKVDFIKRGELVISDEEKLFLEDFFNFIMKVNDIVGRLGFKNIATERRIISAFVNLFKNEKFIPSRMLENLSNYVNKFYKCTDIQSYMAMLNNIYNYRRVFRVDLLNKE